MRFRVTGMIAVLTLAMLSVQSQASIMVTQTFDPAPTYSNTLNFDEVGGPTGNVATNAFAGIGVSFFDSAEGTTNIGDNSGTYGFLPAANNNTAYLPFGLIMQFDQDVTELSFQGWDNAGPPNPISGGAYVVLYKDGDHNNPVGFGSFTGAWDGLGNTWYNITTSDGTVFDEVSFYGNAFGFPVSIVDNFSWNSVPEPSCLALLAMTGVGVLTRRRR